MKISVTILTKNSERYLKEVLEALTEFEEVLIFDNGSTDQTLQIASQFKNTRIEVGNFIGFGPTHNVASTLASHDWILSIDSDEVVSTELVEEIKHASLHPHCIYAFPRHNFYNGKWIRWCGWYPDRQLRLYHRRSTQFSEAQVHEAIVVRPEQKIVQMQSPLIHYSYGSTAEFLHKMQVYSELFAQQNQGKKKSSLTKAVLHGWFAFFKSYVLKRGFLGGFEGYVISVYNAQTAYYKYLKLKELNQRRIAG